MTYELVKQLKDAGFPHPIANGHDCPGCLCNNHETTLSELIEACGNKFDSLERDKNGWYASWEDNADPSYIWSGSGTTPEEAVAKLWLELNS